MNGLLITCNLQTESQQDRSTSRRHRLLTVRHLTGLLVPFSNVVYLPLFPLSRTRGIARHMLGPYLRAGSAPCSILSGLQLVVFALLAEMIRMMETRISQDRAER